MIMLLALAACTTPGSFDEGPTWAEVHGIVERRCSTCHVDGGIGPFPLTTYEEVFDARALSERAVAAGAMPPWQPADDCAEYRDAYDLTDDERDQLLAFFAAGAPRGGDPVEVEPGEGEADQGAGFEADVVIPLPEPYTPTREPDDYRCQILDFEVDETTYVTGVNVAVDNQAIAHHAIAFLMPSARRDALEALDDEHEGPGYPCYGGPNGDELGGTSGWLGSWVPGGTPRPVPGNAGIAVAPGEFIVLQMHYNTLSSAPSADQSALELQLASEVERVARIQPFTDLAWVLDPQSMMIPAGERVTHTTEQASDGLLFSQARARLGLDPEADLLVHSVGLHMHELGEAGHLRLKRDDGTERCLLDIPDWDFDWQGQYTLREAVRMGPSDTVELSCTWDNSAENQLIVDGSVQEPRDVTWGEGTQDEMCLGGLLLTGAE